MVDRIRSNEITRAFNAKQFDLLQEQSIALKRSNNIAHQASINAQRIQYMKILYDDVCEEAPVEIQNKNSTVESSRYWSADKICKPVFNARIRTEAALAFLQLERERGEEVRPFFSGAHLENTRLDKVDLRDADLSHANLRGISLYYANLSGASIYQADLSNAVLTGANLSDAQLSWSNLSGASFNSVDLSRAIIDSVNFNGVRFSNANLSGARLRNVIGGFNADGSKFSHEVAPDNLTQNQLDSACGNENTKLPKGFTIPLCKTCVLCRKSEDR